MRVNWGLILRRLATAQLILLFGSREDKAAVAALADGKLTPEQAAQVLARLDRIAAGMWPR